MMKEYVVFLKSNPTRHWYFVDATSKRVARWCAFNIHQNKHCDSAFKPSDFEAYSVKWTAIKDIEEIKR